MELGETMDTMIYMFGTERTGTKYSTLLGNLDDLARPVLNNINKDMLMRGSTILTGGGSGGKSYVYEEGGIRGIMMLERYSSCPKTKVFTSH